MIIISLFLSSPTALPNNNNIKLNHFDYENTDFDVEIVSVKSDFLSGDDLEPAFEDGGIPIYEYFSDSVFTSFTIYAEVRGLTNWELGNVTIPGVAEPHILGEDYLFGQGYILVDDSIQPMISDIWGNKG